MKGIGNRHMANQEFTRAYNANAAALKLSPVGPSSHVFLSNRAAALLSLRQYHSASVDAKRAIDQATRLAAVIETANSGDVFEAPVTMTYKMMTKFNNYREKGLKGLLM